MNPFQRFAAKLFKIPVEQSQPTKQRSYAGAGRTGAAVSGWTASNNSADAEIWASLSLLRARSRDICRNDANVSGAVEAIITQTIDKGLLLKPQVKMTRGKGLNTRVNQEIREKFELWAGNKSWCDVRGQLTFYKAQKLILRSVITDGEILVRKIRQPFGDSQIPFAFELIEADQLDDRMSFRMENGNEVRFGIEFDSWKRPIAYHILPNHPGDVGFRSQSYRPVRVPAKEILHICNWRGMRPGQTRGVPMLASILVESRNLLGYKESELVKARIQSCIMGHYTRDYPDVEPMETDEQGYPVSFFEPGVIENLPPGVKFEGFDPSSPNPNFPEFLLQGQRGQAQGLGVSSYTVSNNAADANYSSMRISMLAERKNFEQLRDDLTEDVISPLYLEFLELGVLSGFVRLPGDFESRRHFYSAHSVIGTPWPWIDPLKDMQSRKLALEMNITTRTKLLNEQGIEFEDHCAEQAEEKAIAARYGVSFGEVLPVTEEPKQIETADSSGDGETEAMGDGEDVPVEGEDNPPNPLRQAQGEPLEGGNSPKRIPRKQKKAMKKWK